MTQSDWPGYVQAAATLATGAAAVGGAIWVGLRQQEILRRQVGLDELKLRSELFNRRFAVYEATRSYLGAITAHADRPADRATETEFLMALDQARFLFRPEVHEALFSAYKRTLKFFALKSVMEATYRREGHYGDGNPEKEMEHMTWMSEQQMNLADLFGDELRLGVGSGDMPPALAPRAVQKTKA